MFVWYCLVCLPRVSLGGSVGQHFLKNIYYLQMDGNGKKKSQNLEIFFLSITEQNRHVSRSAMPNKPSFIFGLMVYYNLTGFLLRVLNSLSILTQKNDFSRLL